MSNIVPLRAGQMPSVFAGRANFPSMNAAAQAGLLPSFGSIGIKGKVWSTKYRGEVEPMLDARGIPVPTLEVVIVGISQAISKRYYATGFNEADEGKAPDCWSSTGIAPDPTSVSVQSPTCALCPQNQWGSKITDAGKKAKSCGDARRIAVVPLLDIENTGYGGPMLLSIPPMSLPNLAKYCNDLEKLFGAEPFMVGTSLRFDYKMAYPHIEFEALGWLDEDDAKLVDGILDDTQIKRMLEAPPTVDGPVAPEVPGASVAALAGGRPAVGFKPPVTEPDPAAQAALLAEAAAVAEARAKAEADAAAAAAKIKVEAHAKAQAEAQAQAEQAKAATPKKKGSPFGGGAKPQTQTQPSVQAHTNGAGPSSPTVVMGAPSDLDAAISDLLVS